MPRQHLYWILFTSARLHNDPQLIGTHLDRAAEGHGTVGLVHGMCDPRAADRDTGKPLIHPKTGKPVVIPWAVALAEPWRGPFLGGDWHAHQHALRRGWLIEAYPAQWEIYGSNAAGGIRNQAMVNLEPRADICIGAPMGDSSGTRDCMRRARAAGIRVVDITEPPEPEGLW